MPTTDDALEHDKISGAIARNLLALGRGSVISVQAPWGRGKTDVLTRIEKHVTKGDAGGFKARPIWINPWKYGSPDLLTPLVLELLGRIPRETWKSSAVLKRAAKTVISAGVGFGFKALGASVPLLDKFAEPAEELLGKIFDQLEGGPEAEKPDVDPIAALAERFAELAEAYVAAQAEGADDGHLVILVDDLDRCLPDRQVAFLEAIHFITSADSGASFVIAIDPALAAQAVRTHYGTDTFDADRYLDKIFDLKVNLPSLGFEHAKKLLESHIGQYGEDSYRSLFGEEAVRQIVEANPFGGIPSLLNPRVTRRVSRRLYLLARAGYKPLRKLDDKATCRVVLRWLGVAECWPQVRSALQHNSQEENYVELLGAVARSFKEGPEQEEVWSSIASNVKSLLPAPEKHPDLGMCLVDVWEKDAGQEVFRLDQFMQSYAL